VSAESRAHQYGAFSEHEFRKQRCTRALAGMEAWSTVSKRREATCTTLSLPYARFSRPCCLDRVWIVQRRREGGVSQSLMRRVWHPLNQTSSAPPRKRWSDQRQQTSTSRLHGQHANTRMNRTSRRRVASSRGGARSSAQSERVAVARCCTRNFFRPAEEALVRPAPANVNLSASRTARKHSKLSIVQRRREGGVSQSLMRRVWHPLLGHRVEKGSCR
jgi:hypothetical protein